MHTPLLVSVVRRSVKMFWFLLTLSLALAEKLDRKYLPPPGSEFSGGSLGIIQVPLDYPKLEYSTKDDYSTKPEIAIGIDRVGPKQILDVYKDTSSPNAPFTYAEKSYTVPITAFTQTTTLSPQDNYYIENSGYPLNNSYNSQNPNEFLNLRQNQDQTENNNISPVVDFVNTQTFPQQNKADSILANNPSISVNQGYTPSSFHDSIDSLNEGDIDSITKNNIVCNHFLNDQYNPCHTYKENNQYFSTLKPINYQDISTVTPSSITPNYSALPNRNDIENNFFSTIPSQYSTTTKNPLIKASSIFNLNPKSPERIQAQADREAVILNYENVLTPEGYAYNFDTSNGIHGDETGITLDGVKAKGSYSYIGDDGKLYKVIYTADENGFRPEGDHLPTAPPIPDAILKVIEKAYEDKNAGISDDGSYDEKRYGYKKYQKGPYEQNGFKTVYVAQDNINNNGLSPSQPSKDLEVTVEKNADKYSKTPQGLSENSYPQPINKYYDSLSYPQTTQNSVQVTSDNGDLITGDDNVSYMLSNKNNENDKQRYPSTENNIYVKENIGSAIPPDTDRNLKPQNEPGYQYIRPQIKGLNKFPSRFIETLELEDQNKKVPPKPFMTPYVSRNDDDETENYDNDQIFQEPARNYDGNTQEYYNSKNPNKKIYYNNNNYPSNDNGYAYHKEVDSNRQPYSQYSSRPSYTTTNAPTEFPSRLFMTSSGINFNSGVPQETSRPNFINPVIESIIENQTKLLPKYSTARPGLINEYEKTDLPNKYNAGYELTSEKFHENPEVTSISTSKIPKFEASYSPNIETTAYPTFAQTSTERIVGEDFNGPRRPQSFDPITGYHY